MGLLGHSGILFSFLLLTHEMTLTKQDPLVSSLLSHLQGPGELPVCAGDAEPLPRAVRVGGCQGSCPAAWWGCTKDKGGNTKQEEEETCGWRCVYGLASPEFAVSGLG